MDDLVAFLRARLDEDCLWATEASRCDGERTAEGGVHWQWVAKSNDQEVTPDPSREEWVGEIAEEAVSLRSCETWPRRHVGDLPQFAIHTAEDVPSAVGGHIIRHDPARVLREVEAKRVLLADYERFVAERRRMMGGWDSYPEPSPVLLAFAAVYADHPDYLEAWRP